MKNMFRDVLVAISLAGAALFTFATPVLVVEGGKLAGANAVQVGDVLMDVRFLTGTCADVFGGCLPEYFDFDNRPKALLAAQAIMDQVFVGDGVAGFDANPNLTKGCTYEFNCFAIAPYGLYVEWTDGRKYLEVANSYNSICEFASIYCSGDGAFIAAYGYDINWQFNGQGVWAKWTLTASKDSTNIPEPPTFLLVFVAIFALAYRRCVGAKLDALASVPLSLSIVKCKNIQ